MADITRMLFLHHLRGGPTSWVRLASGGTVRHEGVGQSFWFRPRTAVLSEVPVDDRELSLVCHARTVDHAELSVPVGITHRVAEPALAAQRLDFGIDPRTGRWRANPLESLATLLGELAQQPVLAQLAGATLDAALAAGPDPVQRAITERLDGDQRLAELGVAVVGVRVLAVRAAPELERALQTPTREAAQAAADRATYQRRADAVERERAIAENELQSKIELARREEQLVAASGGRQSSTRQPRWWPRRRRCGATTSSRRRRRPGTGAGPRRGPRASAWSGSPRPRRRRRGWTRCATCPPVCSAPSPCASWPGSCHRSGRSRSRPTC